jgi:hypothetical protein
MPGRGNAATRLPGEAADRAKLVYDSHEAGDRLVPYRAVPAGHASVVRSSVSRPRDRRGDPVTDGIAELLQKLYGLRQRPLVVRNVTRS